MYNYYGDFLAFQATKSTCNVETSSVCILTCQMCFRNKQITPKDEYNDSLKNTGVLDLDNFEKLLFFHKKLTLCGNYSDPVYWKNLLPALELAKKYPDTRIQINTAAHAKDIDFYKNAFAIGGNVTWIFGLDGTVDNADYYRKGQNTQLILDAMKLGVSMKQHITWQYIVFKYNVNDYQQCKELALSLGINFKTVFSDRTEVPLTAEDFALINANPKMKVSTTVYAN